MMVFQAGKPPKIQEQKYCLAAKDQFQVEADNFSKATNNLLLAAQKKERALLEKPFKEVAATCKSCHTKFRN